MSLIARLLAAFSKRPSFTHDDLKRAFRVGYLNGLSEEATPTLRDIDELFEKKFKLHSEGAPL